MRSASRFNFLNRSLTAHERAVLCTRAINDAQPEDPMIRQTMPASQIIDFNYAIALANGVRHAFGACALLLAKDVEATIVRFHLSRIVSLLEPAPQNLPQRIRDDFRGRWAELLAHELVAREVEAEFGDEVVLSAGLRNMLAQVRSQLVELQQEASTLVGKIKRPRADARTVALLRGGVRRDLALYF